MGNPPASDHQPLHDLDLLNLVPVATYMCDRSGHITFFNQVAVDLWGQAPVVGETDEALYQRFALSNFEGEAVAYAQTPIPQVLSTGNAVRNQALVFQRADGSEVAVLISAAPIVQDQACVGAIASLQDVTERRRTERLLQSVLDNTPGIIYIKDREGRLLMVNRHFAQLAGRTVDDIVGKHDREIFSDPNLDDILENDRRILEGNRLVQVEETLDLPDGPRTFLSIKLPAEDVGFPGRVLCGFTTDITERKQAEQEREQLLAREQAAREQAETANRIKDEFLAVLSHELRSPLNPILGWAKLLQSGTLDEQVSRRALETIERNAKLQTQLIDDLLDVSRILRGKMVLDTCPVNLAMVVEAAIETVQLAAEAKHIQIETVITLTHEQVLGDATRLQQIVWNLLSNAVKFTPEGGRVTVSLELAEPRDEGEPGSEGSGEQAPLSPSAPWAQITVTDTGKGISSGFLPHVFDYFRQEDGKTTRKFGGLGLGLAIVRHLTQLHGGTVQVESPGEGQGATFTIRLPLMTAVAAADYTAPPPSQSVDLSQLHILIVDDDEDMRTLTLAILEQQGAQVSVAASAAEALRAFDRQPPDFLISDIGMPDIDGYRLIRQIRSRSPEQGGLVPAIALTAYAGEYDQQQALAAGFQRHLAKPVEPERLVGAIATLIGQGVVPLP
jgi:PAS domain S-box-containing protein